MNRIAASLLAILALTGCQEGQGTTPTATSAPTSCRVTYVVDGDTLHLDCGAGTRKVRLLGYDTPEIYHPACTAEAEAGEKATEALAALVASGPVTAVSVQGQDRYGRDLARLSIAGQDVTAYMLSTGLALPYSGHQHPNWCARL